MQFQRITVNPEQMDGLPCIRGLRIPVTEKRRWKPRPFMGSGGKRRAL